MFPVQTVFDKGGEENAVPRTITYFKSNVRLLPELILPSNRAGK